MVEGYHREAKAIETERRTRGHPPLNGLLETTLTEVSIDEAGDANICESKWVVLINGLEHYNIVILY